MSNSFGISPEQARHRANLDLAEMRVTADKLVKTMRAVEHEDYLTRIAALAQAIENQVHPSAVSVFAAVLVDLLRVERNGG